MSGVIIKRENNKSSDDDVSYEVTGYAKALRMHNGSIKYTLWKQNAVKSAILGLDIINLY